MWRICFALLRIAASVMSLSVWDYPDYPEYYDPNRCGLFIEAGKGVTSVPTRAKRFVLDNDESRQQKIMGGNSVSEGEHPWAVQLWFSDTGYACSGTLITYKHVATAAHCFAFTAPTPDKKTGDMCHGVDLARSMENALENLVIHYGSVCLGNGEGCEGEGEEGGGPVVHNTTLKVNVTRVTYMHYFEQRCNEDDYALIELEHPVDKKYANHACLSHYHLPPRMSDVPSLKPHVFGWGTDPLKKESGMGHRRLQVLYTGDLQSVDDCKRAYHHVPFDAVCTIEGSTKNACEGDSGGGLVSTTFNNQWVLLGVVSFGSACDRLLLNTAARMQVFTGMHFHIATIDKFLNATEQLFKFD